MATEAFSKSNGWVLSVLHLGHRHFAFLHLLAIKQATASLQAWRTQSVWIRTRLKSWQEQGPACFCSMFQRALALALTTRWAFNAINSKAAI